ncbi:MAG: Smr/MutS family protein [Myxococcota bacterium]|nr:Smr/MutS family protein [Myxococcota bacterium]
MVYLLKMPENDSGDAAIVVEITEAFDLHYFQPSEVLDIVDAYLDAALERGFVEVRLIHGRGKGVQRARVQRFLRGDARVERFEEAPPGSGGWGATLVWLRHK